MSNQTLALSPMRAPLGLPVAEKPLALGESGGMDSCFVQFVPEASAGQDILASFTEPHRCAAVLTRVDFEAMYATRTHAPSADGFFVCFVPNGAASSLELQHRVDGWVESAGSGSLPVVELLLRGDQIRWRPGRCVVRAGPDRFREILEALVRFAYYEMLLRKLEADVDALLPGAAQDTGLVRRLNARSLSEWPRVDDVTEQLTRRRIEFVRMERHLEKAPPFLSPVAQRAIGELTVQADIEDRLAYVDDRLEVLEDLYEWANDRLCEYSYFRRSYTVEMVIVIVLALQAVADVVVMALALR